MSGNIQAKPHSQVHFSSGPPSFMEIAVPACELPFVYHTGFANGTSECAVCVKDGWPVELIEAAMNAGRPDALHWEWKVVPDGKFPSGAEQGCRCTRINGRKHWLLRMTAPRGEGVKS